MSRRIVFLFVILFYSALLHHAFAEEILQITQPLIAEETRQLLSHSYQITGPKTLHISHRNDEVSIRGKIPLFNAFGERCFAYQKLKLPLRNLQFPVTWEENSKSASLSYGPYVLTLNKVHAAAMQKLRTLIAEGTEGKSVFKKPSEIVKKHGYYRLLHSTRPENLISILTSGGLNSGNGKTERLRGDPFGNDRHVFCTLLKGEESRESLLTLTGNCLPILVFNAGMVLDQSQWHTNTGHPMGAFSTLETSDKKLFYSAHYTDSKRFEKFLSRSESLKRNEVVFHHALSLDQLEKIYVKVGDKDKILKVLNDKRYEKIIVEIEPLAKNTYQFPSWLIPYSQNSHDKVRYALTKNEMSLSQFVTLIQSEYPQLIPYCDLLDWKDRENLVKYFKMLEFKLFSDMQLRDGT